MSLLKGRMRDTARLMRQLFVRNLIRIRLSQTPFPPEVWIENTNLCNATCVMCPRDKHTRPSGIMDFKLFEKIITEIALHRKSVCRVHFHNYGEPLIDQRLAERIHLAKTLGIRHTYFVTNASLLTADRTKELIEAGLDEFKISFYGTDAQSYNLTMKGLDFDKTFENVRNFFRIRSQLKVRSPKVILQYLPLGSNKGEVDAFRSLFGKMINERLGDRINIFPLHNFGGGREFIPLPKKVQSICDYPWRTMVILQSGDVVLCCLDFNGVQVIGNVHNSSLEEVWRGERMKNVKKKFKQLDYSAFPTCQRCERIR